MTTSNIPMSEDCILPVDGIIFRELQNGATIEEIADRYACDEKMLSSRIEYKRAGWRRRPPHFLRPAPGKVIVPFIGVVGGYQRRGEISLPPVTMFVRQRQEPCRG